MENRFDALLHLLVVEYDRWSIQRMLYHRVRYIFLRFSVDLFYTVLRLARIRESIDEISLDGNGKWTADHEISRAYSLIDLGHGSPNLRIKLLLGTINASLWFLVDVSLRVILWLFQERFTELTCLKRFANTMMLVYIYEKRNSGFVR